MEKERIFDIDSDELREWVNNELPSNEAFADDMEEANACLDAMQNDRLIVVRKGLVHRIAEWSDDLWSGQT